MRNEQFLPEAPLVPVPSLFDPARAFGGRDPLPLIPTMISTRLQLELLLQDSSIDLKAVAEVILADPGATLQIFRLMGEECPDEENRPTRIEDCLVTLNAARWYETVCACGISHSGVVLEEWQRHRRVAECARELAKVYPGFAPEEAYLVGLLYRLGSFPQLLGWESTGRSPHEHEAVGLMLAEYWHLPKYLLAAIRDQRKPGTASRWNGILQAAHRLAEQVEASSF